jgi:hypothetical protein
VDTVEIAMPPDLYICLGNSYDHLEGLEEAAASHEGTNWTINSKAAPGDRVVFYLTAPLSSFVAVGLVASIPELDDGDQGWAGHYMADIKDVQMVPSQLHIRDARTDFSEWSWLRQPRRSTAVPDSVAERFLALLLVSGADPEYASASDIEGTKTEVLRLTTKRSKTLRAKALRQANGVCCVCRRDFSQVLGGRGVRVLQVHHMKQLSSFDLPTRTTLEDLAVVCANCHMLLHLNSDKPLDIDELRRMLKADAKSPLFQASP